MLEKVYALYESKYLLSTHHVYMVFDEIPPQNICSHLFSFSSPQVTALPFALTLPFMGKNICSAPVCFQESFLVLIFPPSVDERVMHIVQGWPEDVGGSTWLCTLTWEHSIALACLSPSF